MHEEPQVPHYGPPHRGPRLKEGMVITIEPMLNIGTFRSKLDSDGWTARTLMEVCPLSMSIRLRLQPMDQLF